MPPTTGSTEERLITKHCQDCGSEIRLELPADLSPAWARRASSFVRTCEDCLAAHEEARAASEAAAAFERNLTRSGLPAYLALPLRMLEQAHGQGEALLRCAQWATDGGHLFLCGDVGRGKSTLAGAACYEALGRTAVHWAPAPRLLAGAMADFDSPEHSWAGRVLAAQGALVLDDLGQGRQASEAARRTLHQAIDTRLLEGRPVLITSNLRPSELAELYGPWLGSRLAGFFAQVALHGPDLRLTLNPKETS